MLMLPEIIVLLTALAVVLLDLFLSRAMVTRILGPVIFLGLVFSLIGLFLIPQSGIMLGGRFALNPVIWWFKLVLVCSALLTIGISNDLLGSHFERTGRALSSPGEFCLILLLTLSGMLYLASSQDIVSLYVSLELATIPLFLLASWKKRDPLCQEAGLKYLISGALASALLLYGLGLLYGLTGETSFDQIANHLKISPALWLAAALIFGGIGFKMTLVPFHMWAPDVYEGAPTPITAYLSTASKVVGVVVFFHLYHVIFSSKLPQWDNLLSLTALLTMTLGNLVAIVQENIKRFMAFSAISQAGYLLLGLLGPTHSGVTALLFYLLVYVVTNLVVFGVIIVVEANSGKNQIKDYRGFAKNHPQLALLMMLGLFSLAGIPPLSGFLGKFFLFSVAASHNYYWLVLAAAINSTVSLYYYLRIIRQMYIEPGESEIEEPFHVGLITRCSLIVAGVTMVIMGLSPYFYNQVP